MLNRRVLALALVAIAIAGCASGPSPVSVADTLAQTPSLSMFNGLIAQTGLPVILQGSGPFTVFAPSNEAFKLVPPQTLEDLRQNPEKLKNVLAFHIIQEKLTATEIRNSSVKTLNGANVALSKAGDFVTIEEAMVQKADIQATNGVIHIIDNVLIPPHKK